VESLQELADERAILRVLSLYCHTIDTGRADEWLECFTPDLRTRIRQNNR
jgi:hypothetical protein